MTSSELSEPLVEGIAVIGMACRFPGAVNPEAFWRNLRDGVETVRFFSEEELRAQGVDPAVLRRPDYVRAKAVLDDVESFDASFFGFNPRVAEITDPQQRLMLELAWEALENAGYDAPRYPGAIGVYAGVSLNSYLLANYGIHEDSFAALGELQSVISNRTDHLSTLTAYKLNLKGPAVTVQTTCSTSLVAVHLAGQSLLNYQCDMALAGGVAISVPQKAGYLYVEGDIASPDGHCRPFDERAQGTVAGSGGGIVTLKRLSEALQDGDTIHAVIRGTAINNDGSDKVGYTAPSIDGQAQVIAMAQAIAGVRPDDVSYVEAHGTATPMGDPIEVAALKKVFGPRSGRTGFCGLGSVKSNFGHLDTAAGIAGLIKTVLALENRQLPPSLHFERPNPALGLEESPFYVAGELREWASNGAPRRAGVSSFGIGGTNAHAVLEEAPAAAPSGPGRAWQLLLLSARTATALEAVGENLADDLEQRPDLDPADVAFTLKTGRRTFGHRRAVVCRDLREAVTNLRTLTMKRVFTSLRQPRERSVVFLFPGQGSQHVGMGRELYETEPEFRSQVDHCAKLFEPHLELDLRQVLYPEGDEREHAAARLTETALAQPALFVIEYALARLWMSWGLVPEAMIGHSIGEYVAACLAGVLTLEEMLSLVATRGRLMQRLPGGAMLAVHLGESELRRRLSSELAGSGLSVAAVNRPSLCVISGPGAAVARLRQELEAENTLCRPLHTSHAFHSRMMDDALEPFTEHVRQLRLQPPTRRYVSNLTGTWITPEEVTDPLYWARHLRRTVRFSDGVETLSRESDGVFLELGPGTVLTTLVRQHARRPADLLALSSLGHPQDPDSDGALMMTALGRLWLAGVTVDWDGFYAGERRRRVPLPTYPFERQRYWLDPGNARTSSPAKGRKPDAADWFHVPSWKRSMPAELLDPPQERPRQRWLVFANRDGLSEALLGRLAGSSQDVVRLEQAERFRRMDDSAYGLEALRREDYERLLAELRAAERWPQRILYLWTAPAAEPNDAGAELFRSQRELSFDCLLYLAQAIGKENVTEPLAIDVVSSNMQEILGGDLLWPEKATLIGPCRVIPKEYPGIRCRSIDVDLSPSGRLPADLLAEQIADEILAVPPEPIVAYRGKHRWVQGFEPLRLTGKAPSAGIGGGSTAAPTHLRPHGCYLITGGLGGMGLTLAEHLAREVGAKLVLTARSELPSRGEWNVWLRSHGEDDATSRRIRAIRKIEALGAEVLTLRADVAVEADMRRAISAARQRFGGIHGVIHAAGVSTGGLIQLRTPDKWREVLAPKLEGTRVLEKVLGDAAPDFFALCSSRSAIFAPVGSADYCSANAFLDAYAQARSSMNGTRTVSINWCAWQDVGMLANAAARERSPRSAAEGVLVDHPLIDRRCIESPERESFLTTFSVENHWVLSEHRIAGHPVIPGTTYIEMARAALETRGCGGAVEIHDVFFLTPVRAREDEAKEVRLVVESSDDGFGFRVMSRSAGHGAGAWEQNMLGKLRPLASEPPSRHDVAAILGRCHRRRVLAADRDEIHEDYGPRWQIVKQVYIGDGEVLGALELPEEYAPELEKLKLHPALLDRAIGLGRLFLVEQGVSLPFSYRSLKFSAPLPRKLYTWVRLRHAGAARKETASFDVTLLNEDGEELVAVDSFSTKRVHDPSERLRAPAESGDGRTEHAQVPAAKTAGDSDRGAGVFELAMQQGVSPAEGVEVFSRILARRAPPQVVVSPTDLEEEIRRAESAIVPERIELEAAGLPSAGPAERHARPELTTAYAAPGNDRERFLAELWKEMLGVTEIGIHDNYFELGGDSVLGIQIIGKASQAGLSISPGQLFEHQTIAELAEAIGVDTEAGDAPRDASIPMAAVDGEQLDKLAALIAEADGSDERLANVEDVYRLSPVQQGMLFHSLYAPHSGDYVLQLRWTLGGNFDAEAFERAWRETLARHPILRTAFFWEDLEQPLQVVRRKVDIPWRCLDRSGLSEDEHRDWLAAWLEEDRGQGFELTRAPLMRLTRIDLAGGAVRFVWTHHHLLLDGWSVPLVLRDIFHHYRAFSRGGSPELESSPPYRDYIAWLQHQSLPAAEDFWRRSLAGFTAATTLPLARHSGKGGARGYRNLVRRLPDEDADALQQLIRRHKLTLNTLIQGAWALLLSRFSGEDDVVFGGVVSGRPPALQGVENIVGPFINTLPVRVRVPSARLIPWLQDLQTAQVEARSYEHVLLMEIQKWSDLPGGQALFDSLVILENLPRGEELSVAGQGPEIQEVSRSEGRTGYPLILMVFPGNGLALQLVSDAGRFAAGDLGRLAGHLGELLRAFWRDPEERLEALPLLSGAQRQQLLVEWNDVGRAVPPVRCLPELFEIRAARHPDAVALVLGQTELTYGELRRRAHRLACFLRRHGIGPEVTAGLFVERSPEMVVGLLGVLEAGGAFVPLDLTHPKRRLAALLASTRPRWILTQKNLLSRLPEHEGEIFCLDRDRVPGGEDALPAITQPENLAYVVHTSGSTGTPKGVCGTHRGALSYFAYLGRQWNLGEADVVLQVPSLSFDAALRDLLAPLSFGARVVLLDEDEARNPAAILAKIDRHRVSCLPSVVPSLLAVLLEAADGPAEDGVRLILASGEALPAALGSQVRQSFGGARLVNQYGPTECTMTSSFHVVETAAGRAGTAPIGRPIPGARFYVLDRCLGTVPAGVAGELLIAGAGLTRGYLNRPARTAQVFVPDPISDEAGARMYKTGDRVRHLPGGSLAFLGRYDHQIKLFGHRVEPDEIESALCRHPRIREAVVVARDEETAGTRHQRLVAYVVARDDDPADAPAATELRELLRSSLPEPMVPTVFATLDALPRTPNGKVDRRALPAPERRSDERREAYAAPRTSVEQTLAEIWSQVLGVQRVGIGDSFFALGGDSLLSIRALVQARRRGLSLTLRQMFEHPTLADLAARAESAVEFSAEQDAVSGRVPLTPNQHHFFFGRRLANPHYWNVRSLYEVHGELNIPALMGALKSTLRYHDALRLRFVREDGGWKQVNTAAVGNVPFAIVDLAAVPEGRERAVLETAAARLQESLHLSRGPILRLVFFDFGARRTDRLLFAGHHVALDHVSMHIVADDFQNAYSQLVRTRPVRFPRKSTSFKTWAEQLTRYAESPEIAAETSYWLGLPWTRTGPLPVDHAKGENTKLSGRTMTLEMDAEESELLVHRLPKFLAANVDEILLAAIVRALGRWTGRSGQVIDLTGHGRDPVFEDLDVTRTVGWFVTNYPAVLESDEAADPAEVLRSVASQLRRIPRKGIGYGVLRYLSRAPEIVDGMRALVQPEVSFNYRSQRDGGARTSRGDSLLRPAREDPGPYGSLLNPRPSVLGISGQVTGGRLRLDWKYSKNLHRRSTIKRIVDDCEETLQSLLSLYRVEESTRLR